MNWLKAVKMWIERRGRCNIQDEQERNARLRRESAMAEARIALLRRQVIVMERGRGDNARRISDTDG